ncbi:unnamed protein product [Rotaria sp. Silwood2]|nr:unnamed protein product [Rotaria sp. Silwood2]
MNFLQNLKNEEKKIEKEKIQSDDDKDKSINDENEIKVNNNQINQKFYLDADNDNNQNQLIITLFSKKCKFSINLNSTNNQTIDDEQDDEMCQVFGGAEAEDLVDNKN